MILPAALRAKIKIIFVIRKELRRYFVSIPLSTYLANNIVANVESGMDTLCAKRRMCQF